MTVLSRYILREHAKVLLGIFVVLALLCFLFDFFERWDDLLKYQVPTRLGLAYLALRMPQFVLYVLPVSLLLSTFIVLGMFGRRNELTAMKASGISGHFIARPLLAVASALCIFSFFWAENLVPVSNREASRIWQVEVKKRPQRSLRRENETWIRSPSAEGMTLYRIGFLRIPEARWPGPPMDPQRRPPPTLRDVTVLRLNSAFDLVERIDAKEMLWNQGRWVFVDGMWWGLDQGGNYRLQRFHRKAVHLAEGPEDFLWAERDAEEMGFFDLLEYIQRARKEGYDVTAHLTDLHFKVASSFFSMITVLFTIPLALWIPPRAGGLALGVALSMAVGFLYYLVMAVGLAFGHAGVLPPFLGAWGGNLLFGLVGLWSMMHLRH